MPEILKASAAPYGKLDRFYEEAFPDRAAFLAKHWYWLYRVGRFPGIEPLVLIDEGRVVGHAGAIPVKLVLAGREATAIWFVDFAILPEHQAKGLGARLTKAWMEMCPDRVTFCNERSIGVFRKFGWKENARTSALTLPLELSGPMKRFGAAGAAAGSVLGAPRRALLGLRVKGAPALEIKPLPSDDAGAIADLLHDPAPAGTRVLRDAEWIKWRLLENPRRDEHRLASAGGVHAVFRLFTSLGRRRAHLLMVGPGTAAARAGLVKAFVGWALDQGADDAWAAASEPELLDACAPYFRRRSLRFAWHSDDAAARAALEGPLAIQGIDSDHDLMFP